MTGPEPYVLYPGTAREAMTFYGDVFGCAVELHTFAEFNRADGPADAMKSAGSWTTCRSGRGGHPTGKSSTVTVFTGSSGSRTTRAAKHLVGAPTSAADRANG